MRTSEAVTGASGIPVGYATLALVYAGLAVAVAWLLRRLARAPLELPEQAAHAGGDAVTLAEVPVVLILVGLAAYAVLAGADFGAGFWQLLGGRGEHDRALREHAHHADGPRLGGQSRLADLRAGRLLDGLSDGVRVDRLDARRPALHRGHRHHPARHGVCLAVRRGEALREQRAIEIAIRRSRRS